MASDQGPVGLVEFTAALSQAAELARELVEIVLEPYAGGHIIDRGTDGSECRWARVLAYDPPYRV